MITLLEAHYLPTVQWFYHFRRAERVEIEACETYQKGSYRNRCTIVGANGPLLLSIPLLKGKHEQLPITEVRISDHTDWQRQHWQTIRSAYGRAPYFEFYADELEPLFRKPALFLFEWNTLLIETIATQLRIRTSWKGSEKFRAFDADGTKDLRGIITPKPQKMRHPDREFITKPYLQVFSERHGFSPNLSVLDLLFCLGPEAAKVL